MKIIKYINAFAVGLPFLLGLIGFANNDFWFWALWSTMLTGIIQVLIALILLIMYPKSIHLYVYFSVTTLFFILWLKFHIEYWLFTLPPLLAIYLTYIIHRKHHDEP